MSCLPLLVYSDRSGASGSSVAEGENVLGGVGFEESSQINTNAAWVTSIGPPIFFPPTTSVDL